MSLLRSLLFFFGAAATETQLRGAEELLSAADAFRGAL